MTLFVNLFGGPGIGKSTLAAALFAGLKRKGVSVEYVTEYAKELTWTGQVRALENQISVLGEQWRRLVQLNGKVDVVVNDSPVLLCSIYSPADYPASFHELAAWCQNALPCLNLMLMRVRDDYEQNGRNQTRDEARAIDARILRACRELAVAFTEIPADDAGCEAAMAAIERRLRSPNYSNGS